MPLAYFCIHSKEIRKRKALPPEAAEPSVADLQSFLLEAAWSRRIGDLPAPWEDYKLRAVQHGRGLMATVFDRADEPLLGFAVSMHSSHGRPLWRTLTALQQCFGTLEQTAPPDRQWCAWAWHGSHAVPEPEHTLLERLVCAASQAWVLRKGGGRLADAASGIMSAPAGRRADEPLRARTAGPPMARPG
jgi:hypothetical protein